MIDLKIDEMLDKLSKTGDPENYIELLKDKLETLFKGSNEKVHLVECLLWDKRNKKEIVLDLTPSEFFERLIVHIDKTFLFYGSKKDGSLDFELDQDLEFEVSLSIGKDAYFYDLHEASLKMEDEDFEAMALGQI